MRRRRIDGEHGKLPRIGVLGENDQVRGRNDQPLPPYEASEWKHNLVTDAQSAHPLSEFQNSPHPFVADDRRQFRTQRIKAAGDKDVAEIDG